METIEQDKRGLANGAFSRPGSQEEKPKAISLRAEKREAGGGPGWAAYWKLRLDFNRYMFFQAGITAVLIFEAILNALQ